MMNKLLYHISSLLPEDLLLLGWIQPHDNTLEQMKRKPREEGDGEDLQEELPRQVRGIEI
jgi:hypothetical protein